MAVNKKDENRAVARVFFWLSTIAAIALLVVGVALSKMGGTAVGEVNKGLTAQKIYFPPAGPAFSAEAFPDVQKYAGKQVTDGGVAKIYAEGFLGKQLELMGGGKVLSEVSAMVAMDPTNVQLQQLQGAMFQAEVTKGLLLADSYGTWAQGNMFNTLGMWSVVAAVVLAVVAAYQCMRFKRSK